MGIKILEKVKFLRYKYWVDEDGNTYWDLLHAALGIVSPTLMEVESGRRYVNKIKEEKRNVEHTV